MEHIGSSPIQNISCSHLSSPFAKPPALLPGFLPWWQIFHHFQVPNQFSYYLAANPLTTPFFHAIDGFWEFLGPLLFIFICFVLAVNISLPDPPCSVAQERYII